MKLHDFCFISLVNIFYKLLGKVLSRCMEAVMGFIIPPSENAFVRGHQIVDCSLIANECIDYWHKEKIVRVVCHIDMEKAYDPINREFL